VELEVENLEPSTDYAYRLVASNGSGSSSGEVVRFRTSAPPPLAPPALAVSYSHRPKRGGRVLSNIQASAGRSGGVVSCKGRGCPFKSRGLRAARQLAGRVLRPGVGVVFTTRFLTRTTLYERQITLAVRKGRRTARLTRSESCSVIRTRGNRRDRRRRRLACVSLTRRITLHPTRPRFKLLRVLNIPIGTTVDVDCRGRGCPRTPRCRITNYGSHPELSLLGRSRTTRVGTTFTIRVMKPRTRGVITRIALKRGNRVQSRVVQRTAYLSARTRISRGCADL
jgi:hypothetical protein